MFRVPEGLDVQIGAYRKPGGNNGVTGGKGHEGAFPVESRRECYYQNITIGCI
jgi:hypothetical protein